MMKEPGFDPHLKIAIQTVLFQHRHQLHLVSGGDDHGLLERMTAEIGILAKQFESISHHVMKGHEQDAPLPCYRSAD